MGSSPMQKTERIQVHGPDISYLKFFLFSFSPNIDAKLILATFQWKRGRQHFSAALLVRRIAPMRAGEGETSQWRRVKRFPPVSRGNQPPRGTEMWLWRRYSLERCGPPPPLRTRCWFITAGAILPHSSSWQPPHLLTPPFITHSSCTPSHRPIHPGSSAPGIPSSPLLLRESHLSLRAHLALFNI